MTVCGAYGIGGASRLAVGLTEAVITSDLHDNIEDVTMQPSATNLYGVGTSGQDAAVFYFVLLASEGICEKRNTGCPMMVSRAETVFSHKKLEPFRKILRILADISLISCIRNPMI